MNISFMTGRLGEDLEQRETNSGTPYVRFNLAVQDDYKRDETHWVPCTAWRETARYLCGHTHKGSALAVAGRIEVRSYKNKDGQNVRDISVNVFRAEITSGYVSGDNQTNVTRETKSGAEAKKYAQMTMVPDDDDLPF